jgi:hypothetical protein
MPKASFTFFPRTMFASKASFCGDTPTYLAVALTSIPIL